PNELQFLPFIQWLRYKRGPGSPTARTMPLTRHIVAGALLTLLGSSAIAYASPEAPAAAVSAATPAASSQATSPINALLAKSRSGSGDDFLPPDQAFRFDALADGSDRVRLNWQIAEGYYLYRTRIKVATTSSAAQLGTTQ